MKRILSITLILVLILSMQASAVSYSSFISKDTNIGGSKSRISKVTAKNLLPYASYVVAERVVIDTKIPDYLRREIDFPPTGSGMAVPSDPYVGQEFDLALFAQDSSGIDTIFVERGVLGDFLHEEQCAGATSCQVNVPVTENQADNYVYHVKITDVNQNRRHVYVSVIVQAAPALDATFSITPNQGEDFIAAVVSCQVIGGVAPYEIQILYGDGQGYQGENNPSVTQNHGYSVGVYDASCIVIDAVMQEVQRNEQVVVTESACADTDSDGVCDVDEPGCVGESQNNLPADTTCIDYVWNGQTGCHDSVNDTGVTVCDPNVGTVYLCMSGDSYSATEQRLCGVGTGQCDGGVQQATWILDTACGAFEICASGHCQACIDSDSDGVCDADEPGCVGETSVNLPSDTVCVDYFWNGQTGCHDSVNDTGVTVCDPNVGTVYSCIGGDSHSAFEQRLCGVGTGQCDGQFQNGVWSLDTVCTANEVCADGYCEPFLINFDVSPTITTDVIPVTLTCEALNGVPAFAKMIWYGDGSGYGTTSSNMVLTKVNLYSPGNYTATCSVTDGAGRSAQLTEDIVVVSSMCPDTDFDGVCDNLELPGCVGETQANMPFDTICADYTWNPITGCIDEQYDDGSTVCDPQYDTDYLCVFDTSDGVEDLFVQYTRQYCGVNNGLCDGATQVQGGALFYQECVVGEQCNTAGSCDPVGCTDSDVDGVCDSNEDPSCIGEHSGNVPSDTACIDYSWNSQTGCIDELYDDGSTICDLNAGVEYSCQDGVALGEDVFVGDQVRYCETGTGACGAVVSPLSWTVHQDCAIDEYCVPGQSFCEVQVVTGDILYDANGNMIQYGTSKYEYDGFNRLVTVKDLSDVVIAEYIYDETGKRIKKTVGTEETYYPEAGFLRVENSTGNYNSFYYHHNGLIAEDSSGWKFYHPDHLGSTSLVTDGSGGVVEEMKYSPFGSVIIDGDSRFQYTGQEKDEESELSYYQSRYYDPELKRFTQPDSIIPDVYRPQSLNAYSYVENNPVKYNDPTGHCGPGLCVGEAGVAAVIVGAVVVVGAVMIVGHALKFAYDYANSHKQRYDLPSPTNDLAHETPGANNNQNVPVNFPVSEQGLPVEEPTGFVNAPLELPGVYEDSGEVQTKLPVDKEVQYSDGTVVHWGKIDRFDSHIDTGEKFDFKFDEENQRIYSWARYDDNGWIVERFDFTDQGMSKYKPGHSHFHPYKDPHKPELGTVTRPKK
ncbi:RHS repeat-associated core domain-containing protein [Nanoarchaeota archaeon]